VVDANEIMQAKNDSQQALTKLYGELHELSAAAERMGVPRREVLTMLNEAGLSQPDAKAAYEGTVPNYEPSQQYFRNLMRRSRNADEVRSRQGVLRGMP
jgi:hypothetical protein